MNKKQQELATSAVQLLRTLNAGALATQSVKHSGYPSVSSAPYAITSDGSIVFFFSSLATHTKNFSGNSKASLFVSADEGDFAGARLTIIGDIEVLAKEAIDNASTSYFAQHPDARQWASFGDFQFYRLAPVSVYFVAGFGSMGWIDGNDFNAAIS